jgi:dihydrofolate reductase
MVAAAERIGGHGGEAATIREIQEQSGKDIWLRGSLNLTHSPMDAGVVDEVRMLVCPASRGKGRRVCEDRRILEVSSHYARDRR